SGSSISISSPLFILYKKYSALSVAVRSASFTSSEFQPKVITLTSLLICISTKLINLILSVDFTDTLLLVVADSIVLSLAIYDKFGRILQSINHILKNIIQIKVIVVINKIYLIGGGLLFLKKLFFCI